VGVGTGVLVGNGVGVLVGIGDDVGVAVSRGVGETVAVAVRVGVVLGLGVSVGVLVEGFRVGTASRTLLVAGDISPVATGQQHMTKRNATSRPDRWMPPRIGRVILLALSHRNALDITVPRAPIM
jgi:hypothetical protein